MKKTILILAAFALVAFSCTKTEVKDDTPKKGINFSAYTAKPTKAPLGPQVDVITENLEKFEVTAIGNGATYFDNVTFIKNTVWESVTKYFWPAFPLTFYAYNTPTKGTFSRDISNIKISGPKLKFSPSSVLAEQEDLVAAYAKDKKEEHANSAERSSLPITFYHYLTQVIVKAKNSSSTYKVVVDGVKLANMAGEGTFTFGNSGTMVATAGTMVATVAHVNSSSSVDYYERFDGKTLGGDAVEVMTNGTDGRWYLIPQSVTAWNRDKNIPVESDEIMQNKGYGTYLALKVKITANGGALKIYPATDDASGWMAVPIPTDWTSSAETTPSIFAQGKKYTIILDFFGSNGAGYVDPEDPSELDGDTGTNDNGKKIIGGEIKFNATVETWDGNDVTITISL